VLEDTVQVELQPLDRGGLIHVDGHAVLAQPVLKPGLPLIVVVLAPPAKLCLFAVLHKHVAFFFDHLLARLDHVIPGPFGRGVGHAGLVEQLNVVRQHIRVDPVGHKVVVTVRHEHVLGNGGIDVIPLDLIGIPLDELVQLDVLGLRQLAVFAPVDVAGVEKIRRFATGEHGVEFFELVPGDRHVLELDAQSRVVELVAQYLRIVCQDDQGYFTLRDRLGSSRLNRHLLLGLLGRRSCRWSRLGGAGCQRHRSGDAGHPSHELAPSNVWSHERSFLLRASSAATVAFLRARGEGSTWSFLDTKHFPLPQAKGPHPRPSGAYLVSSYVKRLSSSSPRSRAKDPKFAGCLQTAS